MSHHRAIKSPTQQCTAVNAKRLGHMLGFDDVKSTRQWLRRHGYKRKRGFWRFTENEAQRIVARHNGGGHA